MAIFVTGATGYIGSYVATHLLRDYADRLALLVRAKDPAEAEKRLWKSLQLHMGFDEFVKYVRSRVDLYLGDLTEPGLGLSDQARDTLIRTTDSIIHCAASLNRKSDKVCFNVNLRGTLAVVKIARAAYDHHGLRRFSDISTVAVAGKRKDEIVTEDNAVDWDRSDYDPYARTKKFCEHMVHELLPDVPITIFRPSAVVGDSRFPRTTQFDMVRAFAWLAQLRVVPLSEKWKIDIVPANYVGKAVATIHQKDRPGHGTYHLSAGTAALTCQEIVKSLRERHKFHRVFMPKLLRPFDVLLDVLGATPGAWGVSTGAQLMKVFLPYLAYNTVFDNTRVTNELGEAPAPFSEYAGDLLDFALKGGFKYSYQDWPGEGAKEAPSIPS